MVLDDNGKIAYVYDVWGRMVAMENAAGDAFQEYRYNGLGYRTGWHYDVDGDATLEDTSDDPWFHFAYDDSWRIAMTFRAWSECSTHSIPIELTDADLCCG